MTRWQRHLRLGLGLFILIFAVALFFSVRRPAPQTSPIPVPRADPDAVAEYARGTFTQAKGTSKEFELNYERLVTYPDGRTRMEGVTARVPDRGGRSFTVSGREAEVAGKNGDVRLRDSVEFRSSDGLVLLTEEALYTAATGAVQAPGPVRFTRGGMSGEAVGLHYDREADILRLLDQVRLTVEPDAPGQEATTIEAGTATMERREKTIRFEKGARILREGRRIAADGVLARLTEDERRVRLLELRGGSNVSDEAGSGGLETMTARDMDLVYGDDGQALQRALLMGEAAVVLRAAATGGASRRLSAATIDIALAPDGATVVGLDARDRVRLDLPAAADTPARVITAATLAAAGTPEAGLTSAGFRRQVVFLETPAKGAAPRRATSGRLDLALEDGFDTIRSADFSGGTRFEEERLRATSANAKYDVGDGLLQLRPDGKAVGRPEVVDDQATIDADSIDVRIDGGAIDAKGAVKSNLRPRSRKPGTQAAGEAGEGEGGRLPSMMKQDEPVFGTSDALTYDEGGGRLVYTGRAQLWQGDTSIKGDRIELDDRNGDLSASGQVVSTMSLEQVDERTKKPEKVRSVATAGTLVYEEARRRARYSGNARLNGPQGDLAADRIDIYLREGGSEVERLEAYPPASGGTVSIKTPDGRQATGSRLTYVAEDERYEMVGSPVRIIEECRETTGKTLTFFRSADRILVDGNEQTRTEVKGSGGCSGPRLD